MKRLAGVPGRLLIAAAMLPLLAACAGGAPAQDQETVAAAVEAVSSAGAHIDVQSTIVDSGGSIPKGHADQIKLHGVGTTRDGITSMHVTFAAAAGKTNPSFDIVLTDADIYAKQHGSNSPWHTEGVEVGNFLFVPARLPLLRETALLASKETNGELSHIDQGFVRKYAITPAPDQLLQMLANSFGGTTTEFLKTASGHIDFFLATNGRLLRIETHLVGINPEDKGRRQIDAVTLLSGGSAKPIEVPQNAQPVTSGASLFTTGP